MFVEVGLLTGAILVALAAMKRGHGGPLVISIWILCGSIAMLLFSPLGFTTMSLASAAIVGIGMISLACPAFLAYPPHTRVPARQGLRNVAFLRLATVTALILIMVAIGYRAYTTGIGNAIGADYGQLSITQIRSVQTRQSHDGGLLALMGSVGPVLACLGLYGALRYSRIWILLSVLAIGVALQSPARTNIVSLIVVMVTFYLYVRPFISGRSPLIKARKYYRARKYHTAIAIGTASVGALIAFNYIGTQLGKNRSATIAFPHYSWPQWTLSPFSYFSGGFSALSQAMKLGVDPFDRGASYYSLIRSANFLFPEVKVPNTIGTYVSTPLPINIYTGFGSVYFDLGIFGVISLFASLGWIATRAHLKAKAGEIEWAWVSAVLTSVLLALPEGYHLLNLDIDFQLLVGFWVFWFIRHERSRNLTRRHLKERKRIPISSIEPHSTIEPDSTTTVSPRWGQT
jgi:oligosaccharide repeat unit polymerase